MGAGIEGIGWTLLRGGADIGVPLHDFAVDQINYCLGSTGFSYLIGFGDDYPVHPHHRTSQGSPSNNMNDPADARHILCGALVGGPDASDGYTDEVSNYTTNEVADDYNAGFVGALAALYAEYGGQTLVNYGAVENIPADEISVEGSVNVNGDNFIEVKSAYAKDMVCGFIKLNGNTIGCVGNRSVVYDEFAGKETKEMAAKYMSRKKKMSAKDHAKLVADLEKEMREAAAALDFERAAELRDMIFELKSEN